MNKFIKADSDLLTLTKVKNTIEKYDFYENYENVKKRSVVIKKGKQYEYILVIVSCKYELMNINLSVWFNTVFYRKIECIKIYEHEKMFFYWFECYVSVDIVQFRANYDNLDDDVKIEVCSLKNHGKDNLLIEKSFHPFFYACGDETKVPQKYEDDEGNAYFSMDDDNISDAWKLYEYNETLTTL